MHNCGFFASCHHIERKFPAMWSTLGYFDYYEDFLISNTMCEAFQTMRSMDISCEVEKLHIVTYHQRTLQDMEE